MRSTLFNDRWEWITLACNTGLRPGELRFLEFSDIDLQHGFVRIQSKPHIGFHVKNYQHRYIPLPPQAREAVLAQLEKTHPDRISCFIGLTDRSGATSAHHSTSSS